jgi:hypothetical protein
MNVGPWRATSATVGPRLGHSVGARKMDCIARARAHTRPDDLSSSTLGLSSPGNVPWDPAYLAEWSANAHRPIGLCDSAL